MVIYLEDAQQFQYNRRIFIKEVYKTRETERERERENRVSSQTVTNIP